MRLRAEIDSQQAKSAEQGVTLNNLIKYGPNPPFPALTPNVRSCPMNTPMMGKIAMQSEKHSCGTRQIEPV